MSEKMKKATRVSYGEALAELGKEHADVVVLDADLASATKTDIFRKEFPDRHIECGVAEQNMYDVSAGLASVGLVPFASTFAMFSAGRAFEMIRNTIGYGHLNVKIGATHGGVSVGEDGASHQCCEDFALMRTIPGMTVLCPADDIEAKAIVKAAYEIKGPVYMRFARAASEQVHDPEKYAFHPGKGEVLKEGNQGCIIAVGMMVPEAMKASEILEAEGIFPRVINMATIKPLDEECIIMAAHDCGFIVTAEEHTIIGGLGEAVSAVTAENCPVPVRRIGIRDTFGRSGTAAELLKAYGLTAEDIADAVRKQYSK
ncbi:MAG TPA: transketolase [Erysipelotrichaceae bacterium]|nr:transketolase [Erysipelotrichaceae bacterium]